MRCMLENSTYAATKGQDIQFSNNFSLLRNSLLVGASVFAWGVFAWVFLRIAWVFLRISACSRLSH